MTTVLSRKTRADRAKGALEVVISRLTEANEAPDLRARLGDAGSRIGDVGSRIGDAGNRLVESGAETARAVVREARGLPSRAQAGATRAMEAASTVPIRVQVGQPRRRPILPLVALGIVTAAVGALLAYVFDPQMGRSRRAATRDRVAAGMRRAGRWSASQGRRVAATTTVLRERLRTSETSETCEPVDEVALVQRIKSEVFRDPTIDKGALSVNAERDVVFLRGTATNEEQIVVIVERVEGIAGVRKVVNLLHVPGAPVPVMAGEEDEAKPPRWAVPH